MVGSAAGFLARQPGVRSPREWNRIKAALERQKQMETANIAGQELRNQVGQAELQQLQNPSPRFIQQRGNDGRLYELEVDARSGAVIGQPRLVGSPSAPMPTGNSGAAPTPQGNGGAVPMPTSGGFNAAPPWEPSTAEIDLMGYLTDEERAQIFNVPKNERTKMLAGASALKRQGADQAKQTVTPYQQCQNGS